MSRFRRNSIAADTGEATENENEARDGAEEFKDDKEEQVEDGYVEEEEEEEEEEHVEAELRNTSEAPVGLFGE